MLTITFGVELFCGSKRRRSRTCQHDYVVIGYVLKCEIYPTTSNNYNMTKEEHINHMRFKPSVGLKTSVERKYVCIFIKIFLLVVLVLVKFNFIVFFF